MVKVRCSQSVRHRMARSSDPSWPVSLDGSAQFALALSGGHALGAYQAGAYEGLHAQGRLPDWIAGTSIGAINAAIIAGNRAEDRLPRLRAFWEAAVAPDGGLPMLQWGPSRQIYNFFQAAQTLLFGRPNLFPARPPDPLMAFAGRSNSSGRYDPRPLQAMLERLVDFRRLNSGTPRVTVNATDIATGEEVFFDSERQRIGPRHILASAAMPFDFPSVEIDGRCLCDGGMSVNVPVEALLRHPPADDMLCIVVDLFEPKSVHPRSMEAAMQRRHDLPFANQSRRTVLNLVREYRLREAVRNLAERIPADERADETVRKLSSEGTTAAVLLVHLMRSPQADELALKAYDYSRLSLQDRWNTGKADMAHCLEVIGDISGSPRSPGLRLLTVRRDADG